MFSHNWTSCLQHPARRRPASTASAWVFATQALKGLRNQIPGNVTAQFFGRLQSPAELAAANEMARAKGSTVEGIALLERGPFYVTGEAFEFLRTQTAMCLSHHPPSPLRLEVVVERGE